MKARTGNTSPGPGPLLPPAAEPFADPGAWVPPGRGSPVVVTASRPVPEPPSEPAPACVSRPRPSAMKLARIPSPGTGPAERRPTVDDSRPGAARPKASDPDASERPPPREPVGGSLSPAALGARTRSPSTGRGVAIAIGLFAGGFAALAALFPARPHRAIIPAQAPTFSPSSVSGSNRPGVDIGVTPAWEGAPVSSSLRRRSEPAQAPSATQAPSEPAGSVDPTRSGEQHRAGPGDQQASTGGNGSRAPSELRARPSRSSRATFSSPLSARGQTPNPHVPDDLYF
jgi:hypothetical protein